MDNLVILNWEEKLKVCSMVSLKYQLIDLKMLDV